MKSNNIFILFFGLVPCVFGYGNIAVKYKGNYLSLEEYNKLELCENKWCLDDANRILEEISYNDTVEPCEDFNEFVCGTFFKERALNERYEYIGFRRIYELKLDEERHKALKASIDEKDGKAVKVTKNFYQRCINSRYIEKNSRKEILDYLSSFGKFPIQKPDWTEADLNFTKLLTETKLEYFINYKVVLCPSSTDGIEMTCVVPERFHSWERYFRNNLKYTVIDVTDMYDLLKLPTKDVENLITIFKENSKKNLFSTNVFGFSLNSNNYLGTIDDLSKNVTQIGLNESWVKIVNNQLIKGLYVNGDSLVYVWDFDTFTKRLENFENIDKRFLANSIMIDILYDYRDLFQVYAFDNKEYKTAIKTPQRFEICNRLLEKFIPIPARAIYARRYFADEVKTAAEKIMNTAVIDFLDEIDQLDKVSPNTNVTQIKAIKSFAGYPNDMTKDSFLDRIYANLTLIGNETLFETFRKLERYQKFIDFVDLSNEDFLTLKISKEVGKNIFSCKLIKLVYLYCPATALQFPAFHPQRSQFYNMAMLLPEIYEALGFQTSFLLYGEYEDMAFRSYKKWLKKNGHEPNLPGYLLNNEQMFWLALKLKTCVKGNISGDLNVMRSKTGLKEAFNCSVLVSHDKYRDNIY